MIRSATKIGNGRHQSSRGSSCVSATISSASRSSSAGVRGCQRPAVALLTSSSCNNLSVSPRARVALDPGVTWFGWRLPALLEAGVFVALGVIMLGIAIWEFSSTE